MQSMMLTPQAEFRARQRQKQCQSPSRSAFSSDHSANNVDDADGDEDEYGDNDYGDEDHSVADDEDGRGNSAVFERGS